MTTALARSSTDPITSLGMRFNINPDEVVRVLRATVIKPDRDGRSATDEEVIVFCSVANQYGLNPFTREIHAFIGKGGGVVPVVGIDGWARKVNEEERFDGCEFAFCDDDKGHLYSCTCTMHVKDRGYPVVVTEYLAECQRNTDQWRNMPRRMLRHKAFIQAARIAFSLSGIYDEDEARDIITNEGVAPVAILPPQRKSASAKAVESKPVDPPESAHEPIGDDVPVFDADACLDIQNGETLRVQGVLAWDAEQKTGKNGNYYTFKLSVPDGQPVSVAYWHDDLPEGMRRGATIRCDIKAKVSGGKTYYNADNLEVLA